MFINELVVVSVLLLILITRYQTSSLLLPPFYWNQTTFRPYQDGSLVFEVRLGDVMDLVCPFYDEQQSYMTSELEQYEIYRVSEEEYKTCTINPHSSDPLTRRVITCNSPYDVMKYTLNFRSYLPIPNGFEFRPNHTYHFLSNSLSQESCNKLQILVHDYHRVLQPTTPKIFVREQERKPLVFPHYTHTRHGSPSSSVDNHIEQNSIYRPLLHAIKVQRHSDPYSIKWITEGPHRDIDADHPYRTSLGSETTLSPANMLSLALSSSSSTLSISSLLIFILLCLR